MQTAAYGPCRGQLRLSLLTVLAFCVLRRSHAFIETAASVAIAAMVCAGSGKLRSAVPPEVQPCVESQGWIDLGSGLCTQPDGNEVDVVTFVADTALDCASLCLENETGGSGGCFGYTFVDGRECNLWLNENLCVSAVPTSGQCCARRRPEAGYCVALEVALGRVILPEEEEVNETSDEDNETAIEETTTATVTSTATVTITTASTTISNTSTTQTVATTLTYTATDTPTSTLLDTVTSTLTGTSTLTLTATETHTATETTTETTTETNTATETSTATETTTQTDTNTTTLTLTETTIVVPTTTFPFYGNLPTTTETLTVTLMETTSTFPFFNNLPTTCSTYTCPDGYSPEAGSTSGSTLAECCNEVACPSDSSGAAVHSGCTCDFGFSGSITATDSAPYYSGSCEAPWR